MRVLLINGVCGIKSTGRICTDIALDYEAQGHEVKIAYGREYVPAEFEKYAVRIGNDRDAKLHALGSRIFDNAGFMSSQTTKSFLQWADNYDPDLLWLHNLHGYYINIKQLFQWIKSRPEMQVKWTLHDCWAFTGHCCHFSWCGCNRWKTQCEKCPQKKDYPKSLFLDQSKKNYQMKKAIFTGVSGLEIITPSHWLADIVRDSFLGDYPVKVIYNQIDKNAFQYTPSDFRERYQLQDKIIVLGVASVWSERKGLDDFVKLRKLLDDKYAIVLVGIEQKDISDSFGEIIGIARTDSKKELASIYSAADYYFNASKEETFGLTTLEAISCGTKAIVYAGTACEEIADKYGGIVVPQDIQFVYETIKNHAEV